MSPTKPQKNLVFLYRTDQENASTTGASFISHKKGTDLIRGDRH